MVWTPGKDGTTGAPKNMLPGWKLQEDGIRDVLVAHYLDLIIIQC